MSDAQVVELHWPADHPAARGHFPGNPIIPGAVVLGEALRRIGEALGQASFTPRNVRVAKFLHTVRPGDSMAIEFSGGDEVVFTCRVGATVVLKGAAQWSPAPK